ncbi:oxidative stress-responsive serine-rich protein 1 [Odontesthes bonariensis]|uniref:oxidative stress-responsive serine-rich protein 1 n=1 Tax=Odontesthes bonariensis TaxID=219752 RepID=UPI003F58DEED
MEAGAKDCDDETLQTAFKKLRVDAESLTGAVSVPEASTPRASSRSCLDGGGGAKPKVGCSKDNWHCCMRKTSRGASRSQRRRRSKSPILHPPRFTYSAASALSPPGGCLKQQRLAVPEGAEPRPAGDESSLPPAAAPAQTEPGSPSGRISPLVFGSCAGYDKRIGGVASPPSLREIPAAAAPSSTWDAGGSGDARPPGEVKGAGAEAADFRALSERHGAGSTEAPRVPCSCGERGAADPPGDSGRDAAPRCGCGAHPQGWRGVEVYSFTGLRDVISECERSRPSGEDAPRTVSGAAAGPAAGSPRSCSEQARAYVDDITIEDLSGYMEFYLYIPKKMSHMAEMMYT